MVTRKTTLLLVVFFVLSLILTSVSPAYALTAAADGNYTFPVLYAVDGWLVWFNCSYTAHLRTTYETYSDPNFWKCYNHGFSGAYYIADGYTYPFRQAVSGYIAFCKI